MQTSTMVSKSGHMHIQLAWQATVQEWRRLASLLAMRLRVGVAGLTGGRKKTLNSNRM